MLQQIAKVSDEHGTIIPVVPMEDESEHTASHPFCRNPDCDCHNDPELIRDYITFPLAAGLITWAEAFRLLWNQQIDEVKP
jgi:hypothetical protein